ncbi:MATE family efflux transporter [bacterium]|nr:MATE family efflux transporter [candidate division CSSED10-310 bacterium]
MQNRTEHMVTESRVPPSSGETHPDRHRMEIPGDQGFLSEIMTVSSRGRKLDLTQGNISRTIWIIALPQIVTNLTQTLFNIVDMFWVGRLGSESIAALSIAGTLMMVLFMVIMGVGIGASAMVARAFGARDYAGVDRITANALTLALLLSIPVAIGGIAYSERLFGLMGAEQTVVKTGSSYLNILFASSAFIFLTFVINAVMQGTGDAVTPMKVMTFALLINALVDPCLIFGLGPFPRLGIDGAAWATVFSRATACLIFLYYLKSGKIRLRLRLMHLSPDWSIIGRILKLGFPASIQLSLRGFMGIVLMGLVTAFGTSAVAAYGIGHRLFMLALFPGFGFGVAAASLVGQNLGAGKPERSWKSAYTTVYYYFLFLLCVSACFLMFPVSLISIFDTSPEVVTTGAVMLRIIAVSMPFLSLSIVLNRSLGGAGDTVSPMIITLISLWGLQVPLAVGLSRLTAMGVDGVFWATAAAQILAGVIAFIWFQRGAWTRKQV